MSKLKRKIQRQLQRSNGELTYKKVVARKLGINVPELNKRMERKEKNLKEITGGNENGNNKK